jgi:hypothetical protein
MNRDDLRATITLGVLFLRRGCVANQDASAHDRARAKRAPSPNNNNVNDQRANNKTRLLSENDSRRRALCARRRAKIINGRGVFFLEPATPARRLARFLWRACVKFLKCVSAGTQQQQQPSSFHLPPAARGSSGARNRPTV